MADRRARRLSERLHQPRIERTPKLVLRSPNFRDHSGLVASRGDLEDDLNEIIDRIGAARVLPERFYRAGIDQDGDELLEALGVMHLHLGSQASDELLFLVQYEDRVVLLEINSHKHFVAEPKGSLLASLHERHLARMEAEAAREREARAVGRKAALDEAFKSLRSRRPEPRD